MSRLSKLIISIVLCEAAGLASTPFTVSVVKTWYQTLDRPFFSPPNWIFGPVWTILYLMMGISFYLIWSKGVKDKKAKEAIYIFLLQLFLNFLWSILFFGLKSPPAALIEIIILWFAILVTIIKFKPISKPAAYLLIPYLLWVSFAAILNFSIVILNP